VYGGREFEIRLDARQELILADVDHGRVSGEDHGRVVHVAHIDLRQAPGHRRLHLQRADDSRRQIGARLVGRRLGRRIGLRRRPQPVDDRQVEIGVLRAVFIDDDAARVDQIHLAVDPADADRLALRDHHFDRGRQRSAQRRVADPGRGEQAIPPHIEVGPQDALAVQAVQDSEDFARREPLRSGDVDAADSQDVRIGGDRRHAVEAVGEHRANHAVLQHRPDQRAPRAAPAARLQMGAAETAIGRR
jgi:hypothetical protein